MTSPRDIAESLTEAQQDIRNVRLLVAEVEDYAKDGLTVDQAKVAYALSGCADEITDLRRRLAFIREIMDHPSGATITCDDVDRIYKLTDLGRAVAKELEGGEW